jgi:hypothetical protein
MSARSTFAMCSLFALKAEVRQGREHPLTRFSARGTNLGSFLGAPPTGRVVTYTGFDLNRIEGGRIVESWVNYDALGLLRQLGLLPPLKAV